MVANKKLNIAKRIQDLVLLLEAGPKIYKPRELRALVSTERRKWQAESPPSIDRIVELLLVKTELRRLTLASEDYENIARFSWGAPSIEELALSLKEGSFLSHRSALELHGLIPRITPAVIYVNKEQSAKPDRETSLSQSAIDRAFTNRQRQSNYVLEYLGCRIVLVAGKNTGKSNVIMLDSEHGKISATSVPRTLVDVTVRPGYGGGVARVLDAFRCARKAVLVSEIMAAYEEMEFTYPYHQALGFYLAKAGYPQAEVNAFKQYGLNFDFYLDYAIPSAKRLYDSQWRIYYPEGI